MRGWTEVQIQPLKKPPQVAAVHLTNTPSHKCMDVQILYNFTAQEAFIKPNIPNKQQQSILRLLRRQPTPPIVPENHCCLGAPAAAAAVGVVGVVGAVYAASAGVGTDVVEDIAGAAGLGEEASAAEDVDTAGGEMVLPSEGIR
ncbi:hypothetical protein HG530_015532 [Fusarium avenaceum]|nr:hypothetical protein HG530_015532 [Fusarium avenaceum]